MAPLFPLGIKVELFINGTWSDISSFVYERDTLTIAGGASAQGDTPSPASVTLTLDNRDGRFSPLYTGGAYYPFLKRNVRVRISVSDTSSSGNVYSGFRFTGEIAEWPPLSDISAEDVYVHATATGPLRRIRHNGGRGSALTRYYAQLTGLNAPIAYWPCEEDPDAAIAGAGIDGGTDMAITSGTPKWKAISDFNGSHPIGVLNKSTWDGLTGAFGSSGDDIYTTPGTYTWIASTTTVDARVWGAGGGGTRGSAPVGGATGGNGGGGGEFARDSALAVTIGNPYTVIVGTGGSGVDGGAPGGTNASDGTLSSFAGDSVTVTGHPGKGGLAGTGSANRGIGGTGSVNATHFNGGDGNWASAIGANGGRGNAGGSSAGTALAGTGNLSDTRPANTAPSGGGDGGAGGNVFVSPRAGTHGTVPGGGGGGGADETGTPHDGANGAAGKVELIYTAAPTTLPPYNITRFILFVPVHGGNNGRVLVRTVTAGTIARLDVEYVSPGKLRMKGYDSGLVLKFTSANLTVGDGQTLMVSAELATSGANVAYKLAAIKPGDKTIIGSVTGTQTTATLGNVTEVIAGPNSDITKTAIGHISVQYARVSLPKVSQALNGHDTEMGVDRFLRLANEQAMDNAIEFNEAADHWGFEASTQSWVGTNCALTNPTTTFTPVDTDTTPNLTLFIAWPPHLTHSLLLTCNGSATPFATSPTGTSGQPVVVGDIVSVNAEVYCPAIKNNIFIGILWYTAAGAACAHAEDDSADAVFAAGEMKTMRVTATAPSTAAFFAVKIGDHETPANGQLIYTDNVRTHPQMGPQTAKDYHAFLEEIEDLDQGILKEAKDLFGMKYRTRIRLINQAAAVTLNYAAGVISPPLEPVVDTKQTKNDITIKRHKGSSIRVTLDSGDMSVLEPPAGTGRHKRLLRVAANDDKQLAILAQHLLLLGTAPDERYPTITVNLGRAGITNNAVAPLMSAIAGVEIGDRITITNLPFWYPSTTAEQMVIGYSETLNAYEWTITWNCVPFKPYVQVSSTIRRW